MIIPIDKDWRITSDEHQWIVQARKEYTKKGGGQYYRWENKLYYSSLEGCVNGLYQLRLRLSGAEGMEECIEAAKNICNGLSRALEPVIKVNLPGFFAIQEDVESVRKH